MSTKNNAVYCSPDFGPTINAWLRFNDWSQQVPHDWAHATGAPGPWNSQLSYAVRNQHEGKPGFFVGLERFNEAVALQDFTGVTDQRLRQRLTDCEPMRHDDGRIFTAVDFFALYLGAIPVPSIWRSVMNKPSSNVIKAAKVLEGLSSQEREQLAALLAT